MGLKVRKSRAPPIPGACPLTECLALLSGAWTPNLIWYLSGGPRRFGELRIDMPRISAKVLSARLRELEAKGVIERQLIASSPPSAEYVLTEMGGQLLPALDAIARVGQKLKGLCSRPRRAVRSSESSSRNQ